MIYMSEISNLFTDVFPKYEPDSKNAELLKGVRVTRIARNPEWTKMVVYIESPHLIPHSNIEQITRELKESLMKWNKINIRIEEHFDLSDQYNARNLYELYKDSINDELKNISHTLYYVFYNSEVTFPSDDVMMLKMPEGVLEDRHEEVIKFLSNIFTDRCGIDVEIRKELYVPDITDHVPSDTISVVSGSASVSVKINNEATDSDFADNPEYTEEAPASRPEDNLKDQKPQKVKKSYRNYAAPEEGMIYGKNFNDDEIAKMCDVADGDRKVVLRGQVMSTDSVVTRNGDKVIFTFGITDFTDSIKCKIFISIDDRDIVEKCIKSGMFITITGDVQYDTFDKEICLSRINGIKESSDFRTPRVDNADEKRVELHCHTKMSDMDGVSDVKDLVKRAKKWGHKAIAITDHGVVQAFPDAASCVDDSEDFKVIYGCEGYLVDDIRGIVTDSKGQELLGDYVAFDIETTGFSPESCRIIEIGATKISGGKIIDTFSTFVNPHVPIPYDIEQLTTITDKMVSEAPDIEEVLPEFMKFCEGCVLVAHNADFDISFIRINCERQGIEFNHTYLDTVALSRAMIPKLKRFKLHQVAKELKVTLETHHRAVDDADCCGNIFIKLAQRLIDRGINTLDEVNDMGHSSDDLIKKSNTYHVIILAKNDIGRVNLYRLISASHIKYFSGKPRIPKSLLASLREGLIIGSACEAGELYRAIMRGTKDKDLYNIASFYDYLEIQPIENNMFYVRKGEVESEDVLKDYAKKIVEIADRLNKPCVATCDVHFMDPEDEIYRRIIQKGLKFNDADMQAPLFLRTTEEMLKEFDFLGYEKAYEVVVTNTNKIADMVEKIKPVRPDKCPPEIENSDEELRRICYDKAHSMYGDPLPDIVKDRLERELTSIISNGYAVMYIIAQKLVWKSNEDGYLVGSRGSVGSSFVATMAGITEVNPLIPHYYCPHCHYTDFDSDVVKAHAGGAGCDLPDMDCPKCGEPLMKDGFDIPFETFLGFKGNKEPDIDLNFSDEYQSTAHKYAEVIFGEGQCFKAGTIGTLADKTAYGYVKNYFEEAGVPKRRCEIDRIVSGCTGIRRTTGQHPGGIVVLPYGEEMDTFTPVNYPSNDETKGIITTHFDYHKIEHNLLKLDMLGHGDPTMIKVLEEMTGISVQDVPLQDEKVMSLFTSPEALGVTSEQLGGVATGTLGVPEMGTDIVIRMLDEAKPKSFADLIRISGLSHGTAVWDGNAQDLINSGIATLQTAICTRDDIMTYLISKGLDNEESFKIMEAVRKGKVAGGKEAKWEDYKKDMEEHEVPDWYIGSCGKIQYMFPRAHAAAYVMMAWRIAWYKIYYPLEYYATYFSVRAKNFNYELMAMGRERFRYHMEVFKKKSQAKELSKAEEATLGDMKNVLEMYERGFEFMPIDIYTAKANRFQVIDGKIMPSFDTLDGLGGAAAEAVEEAAKNGPFISKEDFKNRTKASKSAIELMTRLGILSDLPEENQMSILDLFGEGA